MNMEQWWNDTEREKSKYLERNLSHCYVTIQNPTWTALGLNPGVCDDRPAFVSGY